MIVSQEEGLFYYDSEDRLDCYVCDGQKVNLKWFNTSSSNKQKKGYIVLVMDVGRGLQRINLYDLVNKYSAFSMTLRSSNMNGKKVSSENLAKHPANPGSGDFGHDIRTTTDNANLLNVDGTIMHLQRQWGRLVIITSVQKVYVLKEKGLEEKLNQLFSEALVSNCIETC